MAFSEPIYVLVIGLIRHPSYQPLILRTLEKAKRAGLIADYVISTWIGEIDQYLGMRELFHSMSGLLVETTEKRGFHPVDLTSYNKVVHTRLGWFLAPMVFNGTQQMPDDCMVYFTRLDLGFLTCDDFIRNLYQLRELDFDHNDSRCPLRRRVWVGGVNPWVPFWLNDRYVFGHRRDIEQIFHASTLHDSVAHGYGSFPEIRYFSHAWLRCNPLLRDLVRLDWYRMIQSPPEQRGTIWRKLYSYPAFAIMRAAYFETLQKFYYACINFPLSGSHYARLTPVAPFERLPMREPKDWTILDPAEVGDERFQEALRIVRTTPAEELYRSDLYRRSFADLEEGVRSVGQAVLPVIRVRRGTGTIADTPAAEPEYRHEPLPFAKGHTSIRMFGPSKAGTYKAFDVDVVISVESGYRIPAEFSGAKPGLTHYWRRKGETVKFGWEHPRLPIRHDVVGLVIEHLRLRAPMNPGIYEILVDIVYEGVCWMDAAVPFEITVE